ncbi:MAG: hypothetical protein EPN22_03990 [Nitrospirae bacterium]|nr:MAG: hypothetical protein EPN22_03990 [Nitrospirota bacterium]
MMEEKIVRGITGFAVLLIFIMPYAAFAENELDALNKLMKNITEKRSTPEQLSDFEEKVIDNYGHAVPPATIRKVIREFTPGEALAIVVCMRVAEKTDEEIIAMKKSGMGCDKIAESLGVGLEKVLKRIKAFRKMGC